MTFSCSNVAAAAHLKPGRKSGDELLFTCPRHDDKHPSLSINISKDVWMCGPCGASGNSWELAAFLAKTNPENKSAVMDWLTTHGLMNGNGNQSAKPPTRWKGHPIKEWYSYTDADGTELYRVGRVEYQTEKGRQKEFPVWCHGTWGLNGTKPVLYRLPKLATTEQFFIPEGERDVHTLESGGVVATTNPMGAGKWRAEYADSFARHQSVTILPDNDEPGKAHAVAIAQSLVGKVASIKILELPGLPPKGDVTDWFAGRDPAEAAEELCILADRAEEFSASGTGGSAEKQQAESSRQFEAVSEDRYRLTLADVGVVFEIDRLRRERHELIGELAVRCDLPGARTFDGALSIADFNVSSARARTERAKLLASRALALELDWVSLVEEFCQRVLTTERIGQPAVDLRDLERPGPDDALFVDGLSMPRRHPTILFGDGGSAKSYTALYVAGKLAQQGFTVALFDWELCGEDHRGRWERLFGSAMPKLFYARCERPLVYEVDRLRRIAKERNIDYAIFDSVAFACAGPPESAEIAGQYFRAVRQVGVGSLHIAHISRGEGNDTKPFGSAFWHNGARSTWFVKCTESDGQTLNVGLFHRKSNLGKLNQPTGFLITFDDQRTTFKRANPAETPDLAVQMTLRQRMMHLLKSGALTPEAVAEELEADVETVKRTVRRHRSQFTVLDGGKLALLERHAS